MSTQSKEEIKVKLIIGDCKMNATCSSKKEAIEQILAFIKLIED